MKTSFAPLVLILLTALSPLPLRAASQDQMDPAVVSNGNGYFVVWADQRNGSRDIYGARVSATGELLDPAGIPICTDPGYQSSPQVAFDGRNYLVVWDDDRESTSTFLLHQIYGARVSTDGRVLEPNGFAITTNRVSRLGPAVASNGDGFFAVWSDWNRTEGAIADIYGSPISSEGEVANPDGIPLVLGEGWQTIADVASANGEYLVMTWSNSRLVGLRVSSGGAVLSDVFPVGGAEGTTYGLASNGRNYFAVWGDGRESSHECGCTKVYGTLIRSNGVVQNPGGVPVATGVRYQSSPSVVSVGNEFFVVWMESGELYGANPDIFGAKVTADGMLGIPARIAINRSPGSQSNPDVSFGGDNFLVVWQDARHTVDPFAWGPFDIYGTLVGGEGTVSDVNGFLISALDAPPPRDGDNDGITDERDSCPGTPSGIPVDANGCPIWPAGAIEDQLYPAVASGAGDFLVVWMDRRNADSTQFDIYGSRVSAHGELLDPGGIPICTARDYQWYPAVAFDGVNYLVVWSDSRENRPGNYSLDLYGARVTPDGVVLDRDGFQITRGEAVYQCGVAFNGTDYLVTSYGWEHNGERGTFVLGARVTPRGAVLDAEELVIYQTPSGGAGYPVTVASLGEDWLVVWSGAGVEGARVGRDGSISSPVRLLDRESIWIHGLAAAGSNYFLSSVASREIGLDTHVMDVFGTWITPEGQALNTFLVAANTNQTIGSHVQPTTYVQNQAAAIARGSEVQVVWEAGAIYTNGGAFRFLTDIRGARVNINGEVSPIVSICAVPQEQSHPALAFNGQNVLAVWQDARTAPPEVDSPFSHFDIYGARLTAAGLAMETHGFLISDFEVSPPPPPRDDDNDGVPNDSDLCPGTRPGDVINGQGCSIAQFSPCEGPWRNHAEYVRSVTRTASNFYRAGLITSRQRNAILRAAIQSDCGKPTKRPQRGVPVHRNERDVRK